MIPFIARASKTVVTSGKLGYSKEDIAAWKARVLKLYPDAKFSVVQDSSRDYNADVKLPKGHPSGRNSIEVGSVNGYNGLDYVMPKSEYKELLKPKKLSKEEEEAARNREKFDREMDEYFKK